MIDYVIIWINGFLLEEFGVENLVMDGLIWIEKIIELLRKLSNNENIEK